MSIPFNRTGKIRILPEKDGEWMEFRDIDFKFDISRPIGGVYLKANISILGLSWDTICALATWTSDGWSLVKNIRIQVFAGYGERGYDTCIFDGNIINATSTMPPQIWLNILAYSGQWRSFYVLDGNPTKESQLKFTEYMTRLANFIGASIDFSRCTDIEDNYLATKVFSQGSTYQSIAEYMYNLALSKGMMMYEDIDGNGKSCFYLVNQYLDYSPSQLEAAKRDHTISAANGMIGIPKITFAEAEVTKFLDTSLERTYFFYLDTVYAPDDKFSKQNGIVNGFYQINNIRHRGHLRGQEWYTTVKGYRYGDDGNGKLKKFSIENKEA